MNGLSKEFKDWVKAISEQQKADIYLIGGGLYYPLDDEVAQSITANKQKENALLILTTWGGNADVAFRIARCFQAKYEAFIVFVPNRCKSAGTLLAIGATELIMADSAELGPLDVQLVKPDELGAIFSGSVPIQALQFLQIHSYELYHHFLMEVIERSKGTITTKTASEIATRMATGLFQHIYSQLDPLKLGEYHRDMLVAEEYGKRLNLHSNNLKGPEVIQKLSHEYPSHSFVIDKKEVQSLFRKVSDPNNDEQELINYLMPVIEELLANARGVIKSLQKLIEEEERKTQNKSSGDIGGATK